MIFTTQPCFSNKKIDRPNPPRTANKKNKHGNNLPSENFCATTFDAKLLFFPTMTQTIKKPRKTDFVALRALFTENQTPRRGNCLSAAFGGPRGYSIRGEDYGLLHGGLLAAMP